MTTADTPRRQRRRTTTNTSTALIGYVRVSTDEQSKSGLGLGAQRRAIHAAAAERGRELVDILEDSESGKAMANRPGLAAALAEIAAGRAGGLIVSKLDRLSRSLLDFASLMERSRREGWTLIALDLGVDTSTPTGELMATVLAAFAQHERRLIGQRTRDALAVKRSDGVKLGRPREIADETIEVIATARGEGRTFQSIADELDAADITTARGGRWTAQSVRSAFSSRVEAPSPA